MNELFKYKIVPIQEPIYHIYQIIHNNEIVYIGSTKQRLKDRLHQHKTKKGSTVFQTFHSKDIYIREIELRVITTKYGYAPPRSYRRALRYEEMFTFIYGIKYPLCNENAGNVIYRENDINKINESVHIILNEILDVHIVVDIQTLYEITQCMCQWCNVTVDNLYDIMTDVRQTQFEALLRHLDDIICQGLIEDC